MSTPKFASTRHSNALRILLQPRFGCSYYYCRECQITIYKKLKCLTCDRLFKSDVWCHFQGLHARWDPNDVLWLQDLMRFVTVESNTSPKNEANSEATNQTLQVVVIIKDSIVALEASKPMSTRVIENLDEASADENSHNVCSDGRGTIAFLISDCNIAYSTLEDAEKSHFYITLKDILGYVHPKQTAMVYHAISLGDLHRWMQIRKNTMTPLCSDLDGSKHHDLNILNILLDILVINEEIICSHMEQHSHPRVPLPVDPSASTSSSKWDGAFKLLPSGYLLETLEYAHFCTIDDAVVQLDITPYSADSCDSAATGENEKQQLVDVQISTQKLFLHFCPDTAGVISLILQTLSDDLSTASKQKDRNKTLKSDGCDPAWEFCDPIEEANRSCETVLDDGLMIENFFPVPSSACSTHPPRSVDVDMGFEELVLTTESPSADNGLAVVTNAYDQYEDLGSEWASIPTDNGSIMKASTAAKWYDGLDVLPASQIRPSHFVLPNKEELTPAMLPPLFGDNSIVNKMCIQVRWCADVFSIRVFGGNDWVASKGASSDQQRSTGDLNSFFSPVGSRNRLHGNSCDRDVDNVVDFQLDDISFHLQQFAMDENSPPIPQRCRSCVSDNR